MGLTAQQTYAVEVTERVNSCLSLSGSTFIFLTFAFSSKFRKPINRLIFYAALGNAIYSIATLISVDGIAAGQDSALCQFQGFIIQMFLLADTLWNLSMAINVYLTVFRRYTPGRLRELELRYFIFNYGMPCVLALILCFISNEAQGKVYGPALIWCWISIEWDALRIALLYGPAWICILAVMIIYVSAGLEIFRKRRELHAIAAAPLSNSTDQDHRYSSYKTTEVQVTTELAEIGPVPSSQTDPAGRPNYEPYTVVIENVPRVVMPSAKGQSAERPSHTALRLNHAAWEYTKCAIFFFFALLLTWLPSSINRVYALIHPEVTNWNLNYAACFVLPLMGFCNAITYVVVSRAAVRDLFRRRTAMPALWPSGHAGRDAGLRSWDRSARARSLEENLTGDRDSSAEI